MKELQDKPDEKQRRFNVRTLCYGPGVFGRVWATCETRAAGIGLPLAVTQAVDVACFLLGSKGNK